MAVEVTSENLGGFREALASLRANRDKLVEVVVEYPVECAFPGVCVIFTKPAEVDLFIAELDTRIRDFLVAEIASEQQKRVDPTVSEAPMIFDSIVFTAVMRNHFPKMSPEEIQAIAARTDFLIQYLSGFIAGRRSSIPQTLLNVEASAEYAALRYMLATMDKTGDKHVMNGLGDAALRAMKSDAEAPPAAESKVS